MSKPKVDLDFSEISSTTKAQIATPVAEEKSKEKKVIAEKEIKPSGFVITFDGPEPGTLYSKDLDDCTGEEFLTFAHRVFPMIDSESNPRDFDSKVAKKRAFEQILRFHQNSLFNLKKEGKGYNH